MITFSHKPLLYVTQMAESLGVILAVTFMRRDAFSLSIADRELGRNRLEVSNLADARFYLGLSTHVNISTYVHGSDDKRENFPASRAPYNLHSHGISSMRQVSRNVILIKNKVMYSLFRIL